MNRVGLSEPSLKGGLRHRGIQRCKAVDDVHQQPDRWCDAAVMAVAIVFSGSPTEANPIEAAKPEEAGVVSPTQPPGKVEPAAHLGLQSVRKLEQEWHLGHACQAHTAPDFDVVACDRTMQEVAYRFGTPAGASAHPGAVVAP
jgi:hypothetical protein